MMAGKNSIAVFFLIVLLHGCYFFCLFKTKGMEEMVEQFVGEELSDFKEEERPK